MMGALQFHSRTQYIYVTACPNKSLCTALHTLRCYNSKFIHIANRAGVCKAHLKSVVYLLFNITIKDG